MFAPLSFLHWTVYSSDCDEICYRDRLEHGGKDRLHFDANKVGK